MWVYGVTMSKDDMLLYGALAVGGYLLIRNFPSIIGGGITDVGSTFVNQSYALGTNTGIAVNQAIMPPTINQVLAAPRPTSFYSQLPDVQNEQIALEQWNTNPIGAVYSAIFGQGQLPKFW
jgi:hypothetical protein